MKRTKTLILLLLLLAVAVAVFLIASAIAKRENEKNQPPEETGIVLVEKKPSEVASVSLTSASGSYTLEKSGSTYYLKDDRAFPLDQTKAKSLTEAVASVECSRLVAESGGASADYGLDKPLYTVTAAYDDGASLTFRIGDYNRHTDSYYFSLAGEERVYLVDKDFASGFEYTLQELLTDETLTEPEDGFGSVNRIEIAFSDGRVVRYELIPATVSESGEEDDVPERWQVTLPDGSVPDGDFTKQAEAVYNQLYEFTPSDWVAYNVTEEETLAEYGLDKPYVTVTLRYEDIVVISGEDGTSSTVTKPVEKTVSILLGDLLPDSLPSDGESGEPVQTEPAQTTSDSKEAGSEATGSEAAGSEADDDPDEEEGPDRYFMIGGGKIVYIASESEFSEILTIPSAEAEE